MIVALTTALGLPAGSIAEVGQLSGGLQLSPSTTAGNVVVLGADVPMATVQTAAPPGQVFVFAAGTYRGLSFTPQNNQRFIGAGQGQTILSGGRVLTGATSLGGGLYRFSGITENGNGAGTVYPGFSNSPNDLYVDNAIYKHVTSLGAVVAGTNTFFIDTVAQTLTMGTNPAGHTVELCSTTALFGVITGITALYLSGLTVEKYACQGSTGSLFAPGSSVSDWLIEDCEFRFNHAVGCQISSGFRLRNSYLHHNGQEGYLVNAASGQATGVVIEDCEIAFNNTAGYDMEVEAGAGKFAATTGCVIRRCYVHDNLGIGVWFDFDNYLAQITDNVVENNWGIGIQYEISFDALISRNTVKGNCTGGGSYAAWVAYTGQTSYTQPRNFEIFISTSGGLASNGLEVSYNSVDSGIRLSGGIFALNQNRGSSVTFNAPYAVQNYLCHHNNIIGRHGQGSLGARADFGSLDTRNCVFHSNSYHIPTVTAGVDLQFGHQLSFAAWQAIPFDQNSTVDTAYGYSKNVIANPDDFAGDDWALDTAGGTPTLTQGGTLAPDSSTNASTVALLAGSTGNKGLWTSFYLRGAVLSIGLSVNGSNGQQFYLTLYDFTASTTVAQSKITLTGSWQLAEILNQAVTAGHLFVLYISAHDIQNGMTDLPAVTINVWGAHANEDATLNAYP